jgi:hypothetical protein
MEHKIYVTLRLEIDPITWEVTTIDTTQTQTGQTMVQSNIGLSSMIDHQEYIRVHSDVDHGPLENWTQHKFKDHSFDLSFNLTGPQVECMGRPFVRVGSMKQMQMFTVCLTKGFTCFFVVSATQRVYFLDRAGKINSLEFLYSPKYHTLLPMPS